jgi:hypothetical protein
MTAAGVRRKSSGSTAASVSAAVLVFIDPPVRGAVRPKGPPPPMGVAGRSTRGKWMANVDPKPSPLLRAALHFHEPPDHRKTYAKPTLRAVEGPVALHEQVKHSRQEVRADTNSIVGDFNHGLTRVIAVDMDGELTARPGIFARDRPRVAPGV